MRKRVISVLLTGLMTAGFLTGCGSTGAKVASDATITGKQESESTATSESEASGTSEKTEVDFWYAGGKTAVNVVQEIIDSYNASQDQYMVKAVTQADYNETYQKLQAAIAGNAAPDLVLLDASAARSLSDKKLLTDIGKMAEADKDFSKDDYLEVFYNQGMDNSGKLFALPAYGTTQVMYYNIAAFKAAGIDASGIRTWQDLAAAAKKIKDIGSYEYGWEPMWGADNLIDAALSNGASVFSEDGTKVTINSDEWITVWEAFRGWIHDDKTMSIHSGGQGWEYWYATMDDVLKG